MNVIILGNTGFIGRNIYMHLNSALKYNLIGFSTKQIDLTQDKSYRILQNVFSTECLVIMCAGVKKQLGDNLKSFEKNISIVNNFIRAVSKVPPKKIIFLSSASVYGEDVDHSGVISEETPVQPRTYYGIAKYTAERLLDRICADTQTQLVILRPPLIYGRDDLSRGYGPTGFTYNAVDNKEIILWGDGREYREFIYVEDVGRIVERLITNDMNGILNLVSGHSYTFMDIIDSLSDIIGSEVHFGFRPRTKDKVNHRYSNALIYHTLGKFEFTSLRDGLRKTYSSILKAGEL
jgi:UDP-glucose 4-epimerase